MGHDASDDGCGPSLVSGGGQSAGPSPSNKLSSTMPWEWILECLLDVQGLSRPFFKDLIDFIPHIEEPRCSRLLQKVALRYLDDIVRSRKVDACAIPLLQFILKEQGVSNLDRIHSLKDSNHTNLILRVQTEVVLGNLRLETADGEKDWDAYEEALEEVFPEDECEELALKRRNELIAVVERDGSEQLLAKYPIEELINDIASFVEDQRILFKRSFLEQLVEDFYGGVYDISTTLLPHFPCVLTASGLNQDSCGYRQLSDDVPRAPGRVWPSNLTGNRLFSKAGSATAAPYSGHDVDHVVQYDRHRSTSVTCKVTAEDEHHDDQNRGKKTVQRDPTTELRVRIAEVGSGISSETNDGLVNETSTSAHARTSTRITATTDCLNILEKSSLDGMRAIECVSMQQISDNSARRVETDMHGSMEKKIRTTAQVEFHGLSGAGDKISKPNSSRPLWPPCSQIKDDSGVKRVGDDTIQATDAEKRTKWAAEECEDQVQMGGQFHAANGVGSMSGANEMMADRRGPIEGFSIGSEDANVSMVNEDLRTIPEKRGSNRNRIYLPRMAKDLQSSSTKVVSTSGDADGSDEGHESELNSNRPLCERKGGGQITCKGCKVTVQLSMNHTYTKNCWYCPFCADSIAQEAVTKAKEGLQMAQEIMSKASKEAEKCRERLVIYLRAQGNSSSMCHPACSRSGNSHQIPREFATGLDLDQDRTESLMESDRGQKSSAVKIGTRRNIQDFVLKSAQQSSGQEVSVKHNSTSGNDFNLQTGRQASAINDGMHGARINSIADRSTSRPKSVSLPSSPVVKEHEQNSQEPLSAGLGTVNSIVPPLTSEANKFCARSSSLKGVSKDKAVVNETDFLNCTGNDPGSANDDVLHHEGDEGDGHDGDLEEDYEGNKSAAEVDKFSKQGVDGSGAEPVVGVPNLEVKPRRSNVYRGRKKIPGVRRKNLPWTRIEEDVLKEGVQMFSNGGEWGFQWARILDFGDGKFHKSRTAIDLKDKWRNMMKAASVSED